MTTVDYAMRIATHLQNDHKLEQAQSILNSILEAYPHHAHALHLSGVIAYQTGNIAAGIEFIQQAITHNSAVALFHSNLGEMHRQLKNIPLSIQQGQRAVALDPHSATTLSNLGIAYYDAQLYDRAEECHRRALAINPNISCSLNNMGSIYKAYGKIQQAIVFYQAAIVASPHFTEPLNNLGTVFLEQQEFKQAWNYFNRARILAPTSADTHCNLGLALLGLNQRRDAFLYFKQALQYKPDYAESYYGIAKIYLLEHNLSAAENAIHKAISLKPQRVECYQLLADIDHEQGKHEQALQHLDHALSLEPTHGSLHLSKGSILMELGELSRAEKQFLKAAEYPSIDTQLLAQYSLVQLHKIQPEHSSLQALLSMAHHLQDISSSKQAYLYFALGKCYDDMGEWSKAFIYFTQGCHLKRKRINYDSKEQVEFTQKLMQSFTQETIDYLRAFANPSALPLFIVGMPRSGSTLIEQILASHPDVYGAGELTYLNDLIQPYYPDRMLQLSEDRLRAIADNYLSALQNKSPDALRITDKMPHNFIAIGLIHALLPHAKIIHIKRNPLDTCLSCYTKLFSEGHLYSYDLTELGHYYLCYERIMAHWRSILPADAYLEIQYEDMIQDLETETKRLLDYCELPWDPACLDFYHSQRQVRTASFMQVRKPLYSSSVNKWRHFEHELAPLMNMLQVPYPELCGT